MHNGSAISETRTELPASEVKAYLDRFDWNISSAAEEHAFRALLCRCSFLTVMDLVEYSRAHGKSLRAGAIYRLWLEEVPAGTNGIYAAWFNLGVELANGGDGDNAEKAYYNALALRPDLYGAAVNLGLLQENQGKPDAALQVWATALQPDEGRIALLNHRGRLLEMQGRLKEAEGELFRSLLTDPHQFDAYSHWLHIRLKMCAWPVFGSGIPGLSDEDMLQGATGLSILALFDDNKLTNQWVASWLERRLPKPPARLSPETGYRHDKIRIGYLSSDYNLHPISMLTAELFELHDRSRFKVYGYCSSRDDGSYLRQRVLSAFDKVTVISRMSDEQAAQAIRDDEIDILVDLNGLTEGTRMGVVRWRPAPVQMTYLGFVGSLPVPELDYVIADHFVAPPELTADFHPKPLYMPHCYQVNDSKTPIGSAETRAALGLPDDKFIFCCFSNTYKITAEIFDCWMQILARVDNSVLWVLARNEWARENMLRRADHYGVARDRVIFASPTSPQQYLARMPLADVFLDTYPYNSGTTASDALRMGLPILTLSGKTFSSRMAGSLLKAVGAEDGIAASYDEYVEIGVELGNNPERYGKFRASLAGDAWMRSLGDTPTFVRDYENLLQSIVVTPDQPG